MTNQLESQFPALYATDSTPAEQKQVICKMFSICSPARWLLVEYDAEERVFFGYADLFGEGTYGGAEWGYVSLDELQSLRWMGVPAIERDLYFKPRLFADCVDSDGRITA